MKESFASADIGTIGLLFFFIFFSAIAIWVYFISDKKKIEDLKNIPLRDEDSHERT